MSSPPEVVPPTDPAAKKLLPDDALPPVQPPTSGFILQLFLIPMIIVSVVVVVWLMFGWLAHMGTDPQKLVEGMRRGDNSAWQQASTLANLLNDPQQKHLKYDRPLSRSIAELLDDQIEAAGMRPEQINLRMFLCRALGEFQVLDGLPVLVRAASLQRDPAEIEVRHAAMESITVLATNVSPEKLRDNEELMDVLSAAVTERGAGDVDQNQLVKLRQRAAYALGVIGGPPALERLVVALDDASSSVRYNAATGLARHGRTEATDMLLEMLDPDNPYSIEGEGPASEDAKRVTVIKNGMSATEKMIAANPSSDRRPLIAALEKLIDSEMAPIRDNRAKKVVRLKARGLLKRLKSLPGDQI